jgi:hypothetical protein
MSFFVPRYWWTVVKRAFREAKKILWLGEEGVVLVAILLAGIYLILVLLFIGKDEAKLELTDRLLAWLTPLLIFPAVFLWRIAVVPAEMDRDANRRLQQLRPKIRLSFAPQIGVTRLDGGTVQESMTGRRISVATRSETLLRVLCTNESAHRVQGCKAFLLKVMAISDDGALSDVGFVEPVQLMWGRDFHSPTFQAELEPGIPQAIYVVMRRQNPALMLYREIEGLPFEYGRLFEEHKRYRIWIQANGPQDAADRLCLDVWPIEGENSLHWNIGAEVILAPDLASHAPGS